MSKYSKRLVAKICQLIESDDYTITEICQKVNISRETFNVWKRDKPEFSDALLKSEDIRLEVFRGAARSGLLTLLQGKEFEEVITEYVEGKADKDGVSKPKIKSQRKVKKFILPNPTSVIFTLKNLDSDNFADILRQESRQVDKDGNDVKPPTQIIFIDAADDNEDLEIKESEE